MCKERQQDMWLEHEEQTLSPRKGEANREHKAEQQAKYNRKVTTVHGQGTSSESVTDEIP